MSRYHPTFCDTCGKMNDGGDFYDTTDCKCRRRFEICIDGAFDGDMPPEVEAHLDALMELLVETSVDPSISFRFPPELNK